ncbi:hypothetical protein B1H42_16445 [Enterobacter cloacae subsp. cloacae]|nr:hypothetical protein B1H42_16445 [Enterobacter cloacae subsp. cloacae]ORC33707.1 hypothetical protein B2M05_03685 [Enterobacter cloacae subsp. cloacae]
MAQILIFAGNEQPKLLNVRTYRRKIIYRRANSEITYLNVEIFFSTFLNGESGAVFVATDRNVRRNEILEAHNALIGCNQPHRCIK